MKGTRRTIGMAVTAFLAASLLSLPAVAAAAAVPVVFEDAFDRADGAIGTPWNDPRGAWQISGGKVVAAGSAVERVVSPATVVLGSDFQVAADISFVGPLPTGRYWSGVAINVTAGSLPSTQDFYVFRISHDPAGAVGWWQFGRIDDSKDLGLGQVLGSGRLTGAIAADTPYRVTVTSHDHGRAVSLRVDGPGNSILLDQVGAYLPLDNATFPMLVGGGAGIYTQGGTRLRADNFAIHTDDSVATIPTVIPALSCPGVGGSSFELPGPGTVVDVSTVDDTWAGHPVGQSLLTKDDDQYVAYYDENRGMTVAKRTLPSGTWSYKALDSTLGWDSHNYVTMALDNNGNLHVSGNMHTVPMVYFRTTTPGDISTLSRVPLLVDPALELKVTYPRFVTSPDGTLNFSFRSGISGDGDSIFYTYDAATDTWSKLIDTPLFDGEGERNAYFQDPVLGPDGYYHTAYVWREGHDAATNSRLSYMKSLDLVNWVTSEGDPLTVPLTFSGGEIVDDVPMFGGMLNGQTKLGFDNQGRVTITYYKFSDDGTTTQAFVARPEGSGGWTSTQISSWSGRFVPIGGGSLDVPIILTGVVPLGDDALRVDYNCNGAAITQILDDDLQPVARVSTPNFPAGFLTPEIVYTGIGVNTARDLGGAQPEGNYVLRWESLGSNRDKPRPTWPDAGELRVYLIEPDSMP